MAQAVSWARAEQTRFWHHGDAALPDHEPCFDFEQIHDLVQTIEEHNDAWRNWFTTFDVQPHTVRYEDLTTDIDRVTSGILDFLRLEPQQGTPSSLVTAGRPTNSTTTGSSATTPSPVSDVLVLTEMRQAGAAATL